MFSNGNGLRRSRLWRLSATIIGLATVASCQSVDNFQPATAAFHGAITLGAAHGTVTLAGASTSGAPERIDLSGELDIDGQPPVSLFGAYTPSSGGLNFGTSTWSYSFGGHVSNGVALGYGDSPSDTGCFALFLDASTADTRRYCAEAICTDPAGCGLGGSFNVMTSGTQSLMTAFFDQVGTFGSGTATASGVDLHFASYYVFDVTAHGEIDGDTISGTWKDENSGNSGTWSGDTSRCPDANGR